MQKTLLYGWKVFFLYYKANGKWAVFDLVTRLYDSTFYPLVQILLLASLLDTFATKQNFSFEDITPIVLFYIIATMWKFIFHFLGIIRGPGLEFALNDYIELQLDKKLNTLDPAVFESTKFQNLLAQIDGVKGAMATFVARMIKLIGDIVQFITSAIVVSTQFPLFVPLIILATIPMYLSMNKMRDDMWPYWSTERGLLERLFQYIRTTFSNPSTSKEVAIFKNGPSLLKKVKDSQVSYYRKFSKAAYKRSFIMLLSGFFEIGVFMVTQAFNIAAVMAGKLSVGQFTIFFQQTFQLGISAEGMLDNYSSMNMRTKYIDQYFEVLKYPNAISTPQNPAPLPQREEQLVVEFKNVSFVYPDSKRPILKNFNLMIKSGEKIALVGENGAGKSTIIKLLLRFYDVTEGTITINGTDIKELDLHEWQGRIGALFQDFIKYQFTLKENIYFGNLEEKDNEKLLKEAISKSGVDKFLDDLPEKYDQVVGKMFEKGIDLSGGQWQKLALARAFFRDAPILILDEPTSAIDAKAEYEIFEKVQSLQKDKTVIIISHRFSTVRNADRILVLDEGKIIEEGSHEKLMKKKGLYAELFEIQAKGYK